MREPMIGDRPSRVERAIAAEVTLEFFLRYKQRFSVALDYDARISQCPKKCRIAMLIQTSGTYFLHRIARENRRWDRNCRKEGFPEGQQTHIQDTKHKSMKKI